MPSPLPPLPAQVSSAFSQLLNLHNLTEETITARVEKAQRIGEVEQSTRSTNKSLQVRAGGRAGGRAGLFEGQSG